MTLKITIFNLQNCILCDIKSNRWNGLIFTGRYFFVCESRFETSHLLAAAQPGRASTIMMTGRNRSAGSQDYRQQTIAQWAKSAVFVEWGYWVYLFCQNTRPQWQCAQCMIRYKHQWAHEQHSQPLLLSPSLSSLVPANIFVKNKFALLWGEAQLCLPHVCI